MSTFVDEIKIIGAKTLGMIDCIKEKLTTLFEIVDIGLISFYLGLKISQDYKSKIIKLS